MREKEMIENSWAGRCSLSGFARMKMARYMGQHWRWRWHWHWHSGWAWAWAWARQRTDSINIITPHDETSMTKTTRYGQSYDQFSDAHIVKYIK